MMKVYMSTSSGSDDNPGTEALPIRTAQRLKAITDPMLTADIPVRVMMRRGDEFHDFYWQTALNNLEVCDYGDGPKPVVHSGEHPAAINYLAEAIDSLKLSNLLFEGDGRGHAIRMAQSRSSRLLKIDECHYRNFGTCVSAEHFRMVSVFGSSFRQGTASKGGLIYVDHCNSVEVSCSTFDDTPNQTKHHAIYANTGCGKLTIDNSAISNVGSGVQARCNLFTRRLVINDAALGVWCSGDECEMSKTVFANLRNTDTQPMAIGLWLPNTGTALIEESIVFCPLPSSNACFARLDVGQASGTPEGTTKFTDTALLNWRSDVPVLRITEQVDRLGKVDFRRSTFRVDPFLGDITLKHVYRTPGGDNDN